MPQFNFTAHALGNHPRGKLVISVLQSALDVVDPVRATQKCLLLRGDRFTIVRHEYDLNGIRGIRVIGTGKAARPMLQALADCLGDKIEGGAVVTKNAPQFGERIGNVEVLEGSHPVPSEKSIFSTHRMLEYLEDRHPDDLIICLLSGGGSSLMTLPAEGVTLADLQSLTGSLLACGANIHEINVLRKHLDQVKGGGLARQAAPARLVTLILSDVIGDPFEVIASGPTVADPSTFREAWEIIQKYDLSGKIPDSIQDHIRNGLAGKQQETLKPGDAVFERTQNVLVGSNRQAALAAKLRAHQGGLTTMLLTTYWQGEARTAGQVLAAIARQIISTGEPVKPPACVIVGGETTVTLKGSGIGGRNQECALGAVKELAGMDNVILVTLATDGEDGPTDAAGAVVTGQTFARAQEMGLDPNVFLKNNDSYTFFNALGDLLKPGPTGTNVNDLALMFIFNR